MRVQVKFRFNADTGEVEVFEVATVGDGPRDPRHDARHDQEARNLARVIDPHARVVEELPTEAAVLPAGREGPAAVPGEPAERQEPQPEEPRREEPLR
jgi:hypothetical protein